MKNKKTVWQMSHADLASGALISANCPACSGSGMVEGRYGQETCDCQISAERAFSKAGFPERFAQSTLADLDWEALHPADLIRPLRAYAEELECYYDDGVGMVLYGQPGNGKTHVAVGIAKVACGRGYSVAFVTIADWLESLRASYDGHGSGDPDHTWKDRKGQADIYAAEFAVLDDLGLESETPWVREKIYQLVNKRWLAQLPTIVTTNRDPEDLARRYGEGVLSRLWGSSLVLHFTGEDYRMKLKSRRLSALRAAEEPTVG